MGTKKTRDKPKKLATKRESLRKGALSEAEVERVAGGTGGNVHIKCGRSNQLG